MISRRVSFIFGAVLMIHSRNEAEEQYGGLIAEVLAGAGG